jgi:superfamily II DNA/RNA helicase
MKKLSRPYEILVATPGRLIDHLDRGKIDLSHIEWLVLDEADRMLDMGFVGPVEKIASLTPQKRQTLLFSATMSKGVVKISAQFQKNPATIEDVGAKKEDSLIEQRLYWVDHYQHKLQLLESLLTASEIEQAIVFTGTKMGAEKLARGLKEVGLTTAVLHGDIPQRKRTVTINKFRKGNAKFLIATDVAARGIDITTVSHVVNFDMPQVPEDFVHRIGRTGRAGASGIAISFVEHNQAKYVSVLQKLTGKKMEVRTVEGLEPKKLAPPPKKEGKFNRRPPKRGAGKPFPPRKKGGHFRKASAKR